MGLPGEYAIGEPPKPEDLDKPPAPELSQEEKDLLSTGLPLKAIAAFVVVLTEDGHWAANSNLVGQKVERNADGTPRVVDLGILPPLDVMQIRREASLQEMVEGCAIVQMEAGRILDAQLTAQTVHQQFEAKARQMAQAAEASRILEGVNRSGGLTGPGGQPLRG